MTFQNVKPGDRVTALRPNGIGRNGPEWTRVTGRAVLCFPSHVVLNIGGRYGTPFVVSADNFISATVGAKS